MGRDVRLNRMLSRRPVVAAIIALQAAILGIVVRSTLLGWGLAGSTATGVGAIAVLWILTIAVLHYRRARGPFSGIAAGQNGVAALSAIPAAIVGGAIWVIVLGGDVIPAVAIAAGLFIGLARWHRRHIANQLRQQVRRPMRLDDIEQADQMIEYCRQALASTLEDADQRTAVQINLAHALSTRSALTGRDDGLPEAVRLVEDVLNQPSADAALLAYATSNLVAAMSLKAERTGDRTGYRRAADLQVEIAAKAGVDAALPRALADRAEYFLLLIARPLDDTDAARSREYQESAIRDLQRAIEATPTRSLLYLELVGKLAWFTALPGDLGALDEAIAQCRSALRRARHRRFRDRENGYLIMSCLLGLRAVVDDSRRAADLAEAEQLCRRLLARGSEPAAAPASEQLAEILALRGPGAERPHASRLRRAADGPAAAYRDAFARQSRLSLGGASRVAAAWAAWAASEDDADEAAEAHQRWLTAVIQESKRRHLRVENERRLMAIQGLAADTARWLIAARRVHDAALAVELGRAVLLTEVMGHDGQELGQRLLKAGLSDLYERWRQIAPRISESDRAEHHARSSIAQLGPSVRSHPVRFIASEHEALAEYHALLREIGRQPGFEDVDVERTLDYDDLRRIARAHGPLVYIAAVESCGFAVMITAADEPLVIDLPELTTAELHERVTHLLDSPDEWWAGELADVLHWLSLSVIAKLGEHVPARSLVTLIPLGAVSLLPLHAANAARGADGIWRDQLEGVVFRYAPNARALDLAHATASPFAREDVSVLTVDVSEAPEATRLPYAAIESSAVAKQFGDRLACRLSNARHSEVLAWLKQSSVWHFACHGREVPDEPLRSALLLADQPITLRQILGRPAGRHRLAVLSACETASPDRAMLDEVVSFPGALLQAGVAGVVATQAKVDDRAAMLIVHRFFERFRAGVAPARALAEAQAWLRTSTNAQLHRDVPRYHPLPTHISSAELQNWEREHPFAHPDAWAPFSYTGA